MRSLAILLVVLAAASPAFARPFAVADLLRWREIRHVYASPDRRHVVLEISQPYACAPAFDNETALSLSLGRLWTLDLTRSPRPRRVARDQASGYVAGPFSPSGRLMAVGRWRAERLELGVLVLATGRIAWSGFALEPPEAGRTIVWRSEREVVFLSPRAGRIANALRDGQATYAAFNRLWALQRAGARASTSAIGSGTFSTYHPRDTTEVVAIDLGHGRGRVLGSGGFDDLELSASGRYLALTAPAEDVDLGGHPLLGFSDVTPRRRLSLLDLATGRLSSPCPSCDITATLLSWAPHQDLLLVYARTRDAQTWEQGRFVEIAPGDTPDVRELSLGALRPTVTPFGSEQLAVTPATWWGDAPLVWAHPVGGRSDWYVAQGAVPANLTASLGDPVPRLSRERDGSTVFYGEARRVRAIPPNAPPKSTIASSLAREAPLPGLRAILSPEVAAPRPDLEADRSGDQVLARGERWKVRSRTDAHGVVNLVIEGGGRSDLLMRLNGSLHDVDPAIAQRLTHRGPDGSLQTDWLYLPTQQRGGAPLIVIPYPGAVHAAASDAYGPGGFLPGPNPQVLASLGYATLVPSTPRPVDSTDPAGGLVENVGSAVDAAVATGRVDSARIGVWGHSFGGWAALVLGERDPRYRAVIAESGPSDLFSNRGVFPSPVRVALDDTRRREVMLGWSEAGQGHLMGSPWEAPDRYLRSSPALHADQMKAPVLILFGDQDFVNLGQGEEMFSALKRVGKDARLVTFWGEGHIIQSPANLRRLFEEVRVFLSRTLPTSKAARRSGRRSSGASTPPSP